jgi:hypothetical protein
VSGHDSIRQCDQLKILASEDEELKLGNQHGKQTSEQTNKLTQKKHADKQRNDAAK